MKKIYKLIKNYKSYLKDESFVEYNGNTYGCIKPNIDFN